MNRQRLTISFLAGLGVMALGFYLWSPSAEFKLQLKEGSIFRYQLHYESKGQGRVDMAFPQSQSRLTTEENKVAIAIDAALQIEVLAADSLSYTLKFAMVPESWTFAVPFQEGLPKPGFISGTFRLNQDGSIQNFRMPESQYRAYGSLVGDMLSLLEFRIPKAGEKEVKSKERGFHGTTPVVFQQVSSRASTLELHKVYQTQPDLTVEGSTDWSIDAEQLFTLVKAERKRRSQDPGGTRTADETQLTLIPGTKVIRLTDEPLPNVDETLLGKTYKELMNDNIQRQQLGQRTLFDIKELIDSMDFQSKALGNAYMTVRAFVYLHPEEIDSLLTYITELPYTDPRCRLIAAILTDVGSPAAQKALIQTIDRAEDRLELKEKLVAHLGMVQTLELESANKIYELATHEADERVQGAAELAVGVIGRQYGIRENSGGVQKAFAFAEAKLKAAKNDGDVEQALRIFGNLGAAEQIPIVKPYLQAEKESTRREALRSLRAINSTESHAMLLNVLRNGTEERLRETALESLSSEAQGAELFEYLKSQLFVEKNDRIIRQIITHLINMRTAYPESKTVVEQFLAQCGRSSVCGFASSALHSI